MPLVACPECGRQVSNAAPACPGCGFPVASRLAEEAARRGDPAPAADPVAEFRPSWWHWFWHLVFFFLIVPPIVAWWQRGGLVLRVFPGRIVLERGRFNKCTRELLIRDIRSIDIDESFIGRLVGFGNLTIATAASGDAVEEIEGIPSPKRVRDLILAERGAA
jgi:membrane protein YdbS with pleckstrin-like domain